VEISISKLNLGGPKNFVAIVHDITERKSMESLLTEQKEFAESLVQNSTVPTFVLDKRHRVIGWNRACEELTGVKAVAVLGTNEHWKAFYAHQRPLLADFAIDGNLKNVLDYFSSFSKSNVNPEGLQAESWFPGMNGFDRFICFSAAPIRDNRGEIVAAIETLEDITEQKKLESQLRHAQKMEAIGTLAGGVAHDFNNILTAIIGYGSLLDMRLGQSDPSRPFIENILSAANRAASLTNSLLTFGRKQTIEPRVVDLNSVVQRITTLLLRLLREDIELRTTLASFPCMVMADVDQIEQVFMNLTTNARDAMPKGGTLALATSMINLDRDFVATHGYGTPGRFVLLTVTDSGTGMDAATMSRIFDPFFTTKEVGKGTGLGLSMAYGIIKQHNGYINCYSEPGTGTTFRLYLPAVNALAEPVQISAAEPPPRGTETILLAEDDEQVRHLTINLLESFGYTVIAARDGKDALIQFNAYKDVIQLALLDVIMPGKNGREAYEEMESKRPGLKVLFTSGYSADIFQREEFDASGFAFISKPVLPAELLRKIRQLLDE
jgi:signal transduction histidine kinase